MDIDKLYAVFNELLEEWYSAESTQINDRIISAVEDPDALEIDKRNYITRFKEALEN